MKIVFTMLVFFLFTVGLIELYTQTQTPLQAQLHLGTVNASSSANTVTAEEVCAGLGIMPVCLAQGVDLTQRGAVADITKSPLLLAIAIATGFMIGGVVAGFLGAGQLAHVIAAIGILLAMIGYMTSAMSTYFQAVPLPIMTMVNLLIASMGIYAIIRTLRGGSG